MIFSHNILSYIWCKINSFEQSIGCFYLALCVYQMFNSLRPSDAVNLTIIGSDYGLVPVLHQAIIWTNADALLIRTLGTNFNEIWIKIQTFSLKKMQFKMSAKWRPFCLPQYVTVISFKVQAQLNLFLTGSINWLGPSDASMRQ